MFIDVFRKFPFDMLDLEALVGHLRVKFLRSFMQSESHRGTSEITGGLHASKSPPLDPRGERLVDILAGMVRAALAWEASHGYPGDASQSNDMMELHRPNPAPELPPQLYPSGAEAAGKDSKDQLLSTTGG